MKSKSQSSSSAQQSKPSLEILIESLLREATEDFEETPNLQWEWGHYLRLSSLIQKIKEREAGRDNQDKQDSIDETARRASELPEFIQWLQRNQAEFTKMSIGPVEQDCGFGLKTNVHLKGGEIAFSVPKSIVMSAEKARSSKLSVLVEKDPILCNMQNVLLAMFLLYEKYVNPDSFWKPYLRIIPSSFDTVAYYTETEMALLKISPRAFRESLRMYRHISRQYAYFHTKFKNSTSLASKGLKKIFTYNRYTWAVSAVSTRVNNWPNKHDTLCLVPLLDLCNHGEGEDISTDYNDETESFLCYAGSDFSKNTEFKMFYGHRSSIDFLIHNGFVPNNFKDDIYFLELSLGTNAVHSGRKISLLRDSKMDSRMTFPLAPERLTSAKKLFAFINVFIADEEKLCLYEENKDNLEIILEQPTVECLQYLHDRLELMKRVADNSIATAVRTLCKSLSIDDSQSQGKMEERYSKVSSNILQLLRNELKLLDMLVHCCKDFKISLQNNALKTTPPEDTPTQVSNTEVK
ncbi:Histone-lysine N-methyltransferase setd3 [Orchesella cincta]|uniref:protein-histidine N-methyltransferase n=1 Tax=Orchesella cincta TaxID=48709 RepID=A0A1D2MMG8_ORCCI|nr:Histone-lysine N-methyltransferase setd3 [Orchesella cincta]